MYMGIWKILTEKQKQRWIDANKDKFLINRR